MKQKLYKPAILLSFVFGFFLRIYHLSFLDLWRDETFSINVAKFPFMEVIEIAGKDTQPPLHLALLHFWMKIFGDGEFSVRFLSLIFGMLTILFVYMTAKIIFKRKVFVLFATLFAAVNPLLIVYSQEARSYSMLTAFTAGAVFFVLNINKSDRWYNYFGFIVMSLAGLYTHNIFVVVLAAVLFMRVIEFVFTKDIRFTDIIFLKNGYVRKIFFSYLIIGILYLPWLFVFLGQFSKVDSEGFWLTFRPFKDPVDNYPWFFVSQSYSNNFKGLDDINNFLIRFLGISLSLLGMLYEIVHLKKKMPKLTILTLSMFILVYLISFNTPFFYIRYIIFITPFLLILMAKGLGALEKTIKYKPVLAFGAIYIVSSTLFYLTNISQNVSKSEYEKAVSEIEFNYDSDVILHPHAGTYHSFIYYSDLPSSIYDPNKDLAYYEGLAYIEDEDYFEGSIKSYQRIWVINLWKDEGFEEELTQSGFVKEKTMGYQGGLYIDLWIRGSRIEIAVSKL